MKRQLAISYPAATARTPTPVKKGIFFMTKQVKLCVVLLLRVFIVCFSVCLPTKGCLDNAWFLLFSRMLAATQKEKAQVVSKEIKDVVLVMVCKDEERSGYNLRDKGPMSRN